MKEALKVIQSMRDGHLLGVWEATQIVHPDLHDPGPYDCRTLEDWTILINHEIWRRNLQGSI